MSAVHIAKVFLLLHDSQITRCNCGHNIEVKCTSPKWRFYPSFCQASFIVHILKATVWSMRYLTIARKSIGFIAKRDFPHFVKKMQCSLLISLWHWHDVRFLSEQRQKRFGYTRDISNFILRIVVEQFDPSHKLLWRQVLLQSIPDEFLWHTVKFFLLI